MVSKFQTKKTAALFAYLAANPDRDHSRERLIDLVWPGEDPAQTKDRLNQALSWIRRHIPLEFVSDRYHVRLVSGGYATDVQEFEERLKRANVERDQAARKQLLREALALSEADFLADLGDDWIIDERDRLHQVQVGAMRELIGRLEVAGEYEEAISWAERMVRQDELDEENHYSLIRLQLLSGDDRAAKRQHAKLSQILSRELHLEPSLNFEDMAQAQRPGPRPVASPQAEEAAPFLVPAPQNRFYGRSEELTRMENLLESGTTRLITITGIGGAGKTRLALETANRLRLTSPNPQWFVSLAEIEDSREVGNAILKVVGKDRQPGRPALGQILDELAKWRSPLVILDNFEHVSDGAKVVGDLLAQHGGLKVIATSRQKLNLQAEVEVQLRPLPTPDEKGSEAESVLLFLDRSQLSDRKSDLAHRETEELFEICRRLEGIPLAIEIAAAWTNTFSLSEILGRLDERFEFLVNRRRDIVDRHRSLRAAIEYSYRLLPESLQRLFAALSVFRGGWTSEAASHLMGEPSVHAALTELSDRSLIFAVPHGHTTRFRMYDTLREFASDQLTGSERAELEGRHAEYYAGYLHELHEMEDAMPLSDRLDLMEAELANVAIALDWCDRYRQAQMGLGLARDMARLWKSRGPIDSGRNWLNLFLGHPQDDLSRAQGLLALGNLAWIQSDFDQAKAAHTEALSLYTQLNDGEGTAASNFQLGIVAVRRGEHELAEKHLKSILDIGTSDRSLLGRAYLNLGNIAMDSGRRAEAKSFYERSLVIERERNDTERVSFTYNNLGLLAFLYGQFTLATFYLEEAIRYGTLSGNPNSVDAAHANLARIATRRGQFGKAAEQMLIAFTDFAKFGNKIFLRLAMVEYALLFGKLGDYVKAARILAIAESLSEDLGIPFGNTEMPTYDEVCAVLAGTFSEEDRKEIEEFVSMQSFPEKLDYVMRQATDVAGSF